MPLSLDQYADYLDTRDLSWPAPPTPQKPKAKPHLVPLPEVRLVTWNIYGTLLSIASGELFFEHPQKFIMDTALEKTVQEFKMWGSMSRKPGQPSEYMGQIYRNVLSEQKMAPSPGEKYPELQADKIWDAILKKLMQKDFKFDAGFFGSLNEFAKKIAYFFHASLQGTACHESAAAALQHVHASGLQQGLLADAQCFTSVQLDRGLKQQGCQSIRELIPPEACALSFEQKGRKPSERLFRHLLNWAGEKSIGAHEILHVGARINQDIAPAKKLGMRTALYAGDKESLQATPDQLKEAATRPDVLLTELTQVREIVGTS